jgi:hypothetical protein
MEGRSECCMSQTDYDKEKGCCLNEGRMKGGSDGGMKGGRDEGRE